MNIWDTVAIVVGSILGLALGLALLLLLLSPRSLPRNNGTAAYATSLIRLPNGLWKLSVRKLGGSGYWSSAPQPWAVKIGDEIIESGSWTYDFRAETHKTVAEGHGAPTSAEVEIGGFGTLKTGTEKND